jgi:hypothetical protein
MGLLVVATLTARVQLGWLSRPIGKKALLLAFLKVFETGDIAELNANIPDVRQNLDVDSKLPFINRNHDGSYRRELQASRSGLKLPGDF